MTTIDDDTLRAMLSAAPPGPWRTMQSYAGPWWVGRTGPCGCQRPDCDRGFTVVDDEHGAALAAAAPALAAEVLRLRAEIGRRDADDAESECREIERHQRMCAALDIPEEDRAYATDEEVEAAAIDAVCERDALAAEVLRLRAAARADSDASGYLADHAAALLDLGAATSRAEKAEAAHATIQRVAREYFAALDTGNAHLAGAVIERDDPHYTALVIAEQAAEARLRALVGEGGR